MKNKRIIAAVIAFVVIATGAWVFLRGSGKEAVTYRFATVERGDLESSVSATGVLNAVTTVQVGTQVSGQVAAIYVDFNDRVTAGQLLARIDATLSEQSVREAEAGLARASAELEQARREYDRNKGLYERKVVTDKEMNAVKYALEIALANMRSAQVSLDRARRNLAYTAIHAPVDGIVVERNVDVGQTVAASLSTPQLFLIAKDLSEMQILASVDESDIGSIHEGQEVRFTVQAYENRKFMGIVRQVRLQSTTQENVVSYTAVVAVKNPDRKLLPGMTATVEFLTGSAKNVLTVPNAALRFRPPEAAATQARAPQGTQGAQGVQGTPTAAATGRARFAGGSPKSSKLWYLGPDNKPVALPVTAGLTNGATTEVTAANLKEGMQVIIGMTGGATETTSAAATNPLQGQQQSGGRRPGGF